MDIGAILLVDCSMDIGAILLVDCSMDIGAILLVDCSMDIRAILLMDCFMIHQFSSHYPTLKISFYMFSNQLKHSIKKM